MAVQAAHDVSATLEDHGRLIDLLTLALTHGLIVLALWRLTFRDELDVEAAPEGRGKPWLRDGTRAPDEASGDA